MNTVKQGPLECGLYVAWWMEEEVREKLGEGKWPRGRPDISNLREKMWKAFLNLEPACLKMHMRNEDLNDAEGAAINNHDEAAKLATHAGVVGDAAKTLAHKAMEDMSAGKKGDLLDVEVAPSTYLDKEHWA